MIRDGIDEHSLHVCRRLCDSCDHRGECKMTDIDRQLREDGWQPLETAPLCDWVSWRNGTDPIEVETTEMWFEGLTINGTVVQACYHAEGDYKDRWIDAWGKTLNTLSHWRQTPII